MKRTVQSGMRLRNGTQSARTSEVEDRNRRTGKQKVAKRGISALGGNEASPATETDLSPFAGEKETGGSFAQ